MAHVLIIDDNASVRMTLMKVIQRHGHTVVTAACIEEGFQAARSKDVDVVFLDVGLPDGSGLDIIAALRETPSSPEVIIITASGDSDGAEMAIRNGAWDYIEKAASMSAMTLPLIRALEYRQAKRGLKNAESLKLDGIIGSSHQIKACYDQVAKAAGSDANVLITGETGTGKEIFAWAVHSNSTRNRRGFVTVDCTSLPETLVESVLFGHLKGSFTGATANFEGLVHQADGGTLFLDEVGELTPPLQKTFLRVLEEHRFRPIGAKEEVRSDFRLIAATNRDLENMVKKGEFREDLLFRLKTIAIALPPLRNRKGDTQDLAQYFVERVCRKYEIPPKKFSPEFVEFILDYDWPGNVRELAHAIEMVIAEARQEPLLYPKHLPNHIRIQVARKRLKKKTSVNSVPTDGILQGSANLYTLREARVSGLAALESRYLTDLMDCTGGDMREACRISGLSTPRLYGLLKQHRIAKPPRRSI
jgi:two-component system, NtrC family, response regulator